MRDNPFACSDRLTALHRRFLAERGNPVSMNEHGVEWLIGELASALAEAKANENEISRLRWNRLGDPDPARVSAAMAAPKSNVVAMIPRRPFDDGAPDGGGRAA